jgi:tRNA 5-methylaminomethyl-2-thiouridine biosynthesis bifunctional protein
MIRDAVTVEPDLVLQAWLAGVEVVRARVAGLEQDGLAWRLLDQAGGLVGEADVVCLATGPAVAGLAELPLRAVRGQASWTSAPFEGAAASWGGYAAPMRRRGFLFGATHDRDDWGAELRPEDHLRNLQSLQEGRPRLAQRMEPAALSGRASLRAMSPDHLPMAGAVPGRPGLFVLSGFGGRGFALAPLLAEQVAALATGAPRPLARTLGALVDPTRFGRR